MLHQSQKKRDYVNHNDGLTGPSFGAAVDILVFGSFVSPGLVYDNSVHFGCPAVLIS